MDLDVFKKQLVCLLICMPYAKLVTMTSLPGDNNTRLKRQAGYVYNRPNISFDLPARPIISTQAPTVSRTPTQAQQMYYAYPVPAPSPAPVIAGENTIISIGGSTASSATTNTPTGYTYGTVNSQTQTVQTQGTTGAFNYGGQGVQGGYSASTQGTTAVSGGTQSTITVGNIGSTTNFGSAGYIYSSPSSTTGVTPSSSVPTTIQQGTTGVSTNAPKYLPPTGPIESNSYLPPAGGTSSTSIASTPGYTASTSSTPGYSPVPQPTSGYLPPNTPLLMLSTGYLPPNPSPTPGIVRTIPSSANPPPTPTVSNLPPNFSGSPSQVPISTPAPTYLPPVL